MDLSVITATFQRPESLQRCLTQFASQQCAGLRCEQIIVSDGPDERARKLCDRPGMRYLELAERQGLWGAYAKDAGIDAARGDYVCFWDDDNLYEPQALAMLYATALGVDIGIVRTRYLFRRREGSALIPRSWEGHFRLGDIDTMCVCVRREVALRSRWGDGQVSRGDDFRWLHRLEQTGVSLRYAPVVIGTHV